MSETVIQGIATQLGISVEQASSMLETYLPQYAAITAYQTIIPLVILAFFLIIFIIIDIMLIRASINYNSHGQDMRDLITVTSVICFIATLVLSIYVVLSAVTNLPSAISWLVAPDVQLLIEATAAIGG